MKTILLTAASLLAAFHVQASLIASDDAGQAAYSGGFLNSTDGGSGFQPWALSFTGGGGSYIGGTGLGAGSFGIYAGGGAGSSAVAQRSFDASLNIGDEFSIQLGHTSIQGGGEVGISLFSGSNYRFNMKSVGGDWLLNDGGSDFTSGLPYTPNTPLTFRFTRGAAANGYSVVITQGANTYNGLNYTGTSGTMDISRIDLYSSAQGGGENLGFNNLQINAVPEPASGALLGLGLMIFAALRRR